MDFGALPPEINSARMYSGPGSGSLLAAAAGWDGLAEDLYSAATSVSSVVSGLTGQWLGPASASMATAVAPYVAWLTATAGQAELTANQARAAAAAHATAYAMTVPPPVIAANRSLLMTLIATNFLGQNTPAIAATEAHYWEMWAQDAAAMYGYAAGSAAATQFTPFSPPPQVANPAAAASQTAAATGASTQAALSQVVTVMPQALHSLTTAGSASAAASDAGESSLGSLAGVTSLLLPLRMATMPLMMLSRLAMMGSMGARTAGVVGPAAAAAEPAVAAAAAPAMAAMVTVPAASTVSAGMAQAMSVGALSVPPSWAVTAAPTAAAPATLMSEVLPASTAPAAGHSMNLAGVPPMMPMAQMAGRGVSEAGSRLDPQPGVMLRSPVGG